MVAQVRRLQSIADTPPCGALGGCLTCRACLANSAVGTALLSRSFVADVLLAEGCFAATCAPPQRTAERRGGRVPTNSNSPTTQPALPSSGRSKQQLRRQLSRRRLAKTSLLTVQLMRGKRRQPPLPC